MRGPSAARAGLTMVETLVTLVLVVVLLTVVGSVLVSARAAAEAEERAVGPWRALDLAAELLAEEVGMAGVVPSELDSSSPDVTVLGASGTAPGGAVLRVVFMDDRLSGPAQPRDLTFEAATDARGVAQLYRRSGTGSRQPVVEDVKRIALLAVIDAEGRFLTGASAIGAHFGARALVLRLSSSSGVERRFVAQLAGRPTVEVRP